MRLAQSVKIDFVMYLEIMSQVWVLDKLGTIIILCIPDMPEQTLDPDQMPQNAASDQGLYSYCLPLIQQL